MLFKIVASGISPEGGGKNLKSLMASVTQGPRLLCDHYRLPKWFQPVRELYAF